MAQDPSLTFATERELLRLALGNSARSVLLLLAAVAYVVYVGLNAGALAAAALTGVLGLANSAWRWQTARRLLARPALNEAELASAVRQIEANAALAGLVWVVASVGIYPRLEGVHAIAYAVIVVGSIAVAATFMGLVGRAFLILSGLQLGALVAVSAFGTAHGSLALAILVTVFGFIMHRAAQAFRSSTERAIQHGFEIDAANEALKKALESAEAANIAKSQFLATMSHEIRTPMNGVLGALDLLRRTPLEAAQRRLVRTAASSGEALLGILNDVLDHSKIEAGKLDLSRGSMSPRQLAQSVVNLFRANAQGKGILLLLEVDPLTAERVWGDAQRLKQVLLNLVGNAIKFTERGAVTLSLQPVLSSPAGKVAIAFSVRDTGIGMPPEELEAVFEPFHQVGGARHRRRGGTGLGLAISQRIVRAMGSQIEVQSAQGEGSTFQFVLVLELDTESPPDSADDTSPAPLEDAQALQGTVLVVEDNPVNRLIASEMLHNMGLESLQAENGQQALDLLERQSVDLVLMDVQMPVMDGYEATQKIRQRESQLGASRVPIIAVTANAFGEDAAQAFEVGMDEHLAKPFTQAQLRSLVSRFI
ncbi:MAG: response regulator [Rubrivivax sp.]|nr:response regulator [Rubrivivax sp.]